MQKYHQIMDRLDAVCNKLGIERVGDEPAINALERYADELSDANASNEES